MSASGAAGAAKHWVWPQPPHAALSPCSSWGEGSQNAGFETSGTTPPSAFHSYRERGECCEEDTMMQRGHNDAKRTQCCKGDAMLQRGCSVASFQNIVTPFASLLQPPMV